MYEQSKAVFPSVRGYANAASSGTKVHVYSIIKFMQGPHPQRNKMDKTYTSNIKIVFKALLCVAYGYQNGVR